MLAHAVLLMTGLLLALVPAAGVTRLVMVSGSGQVAHAWVAVGTKEYETVFATPLVTHVAPDDAKVRFTCVTAGCTLPPQVVGENANRANASAFDVNAENGVASIALTARTPTVEPITVVAQSADGKGPRVKFTLIAR